MCGCVCVDPWHLIKIYISSVSYIWRGEVLCTPSRYLCISYIIYSLGSYGRGMCFVRAEQLGNKDPKKGCHFFILHSRQSITLSSLLLPLWRRGGGDEKTRTSVKNPSPWWCWFRFVIGTAHSTRKNLWKYCHRPTTLLLYKTQSALHNHIIYSHMYIRV